MLNSDDMIFQHSLIGIAFVGMDGSWLKVNDALCETFGYTKEELLQKNFMSLVYQEDANLCENRHEHLLAGTTDRHSIEIRCIHKLGYTIRVTMMHSLVRDAAGEAAHYIVQIKEIADRKRMELELEESRERHRSLHDCNQNGIITCDLSGNILAVNPAAEKLTGYASEELLRRKIFALFSSDHNLFVFKNTGFEVNIRHKEGTTLEVEAMDVPIRMKDKLEGYYIIFKNISQKKKVLETLRQTQLEVAEILQNQQGMTFKFKKINGRFIHTLCDGELLYKLGFSPKQVIGKDLKEIFPAEIAERKENYYNRAWNGEDNVLYEGTTGEVTYLASLKPVIKDGLVTEVIASCVDITERKKAEMTFMETKALYSTLVENALVGVFLYEEGKLVYLNPHLANMFGYNQTEFLQLKYVDLIIEEDYIQLKEQTTKMLVDKGSKLDFQIRGRKKDNKIIYLEGNLSFITYKDRLSILGTVVDLTYKTQSEQLLVETADRYQKLIKFLPEPIVVHEDGIINYTNVSAIKLVKAANESELIGKSLMDFFHPEDREEVMKRLHQVTETDEPIEFVERKIYCVTGERIEIETSSIRIHSKGGRNVVLSVLRDVTGKKQAEERLIRSEKLSAAGQLAAGVAHEIRNPLTSLKGFTQFFKAKFTDHTDLFDLMLEELNRINIIVNDFMSLAKPHVNEFKQGNIVQILQSVISIVETQAIMMNVNIMKNYTDEIPPVYCDENRLNQVFLNIIKNAIEAMPEGGDVTITIKRLESNHLLIRIKDQGRGIPETVISRIGEPFFTTKEKGTGLGLTMSQRIIQSHNGNFEIYSKNNNGTTVDITLPILMS